MVIIGLPASPFFRYLKVAMELKGISHTEDILNPYLEKERHHLISPDLHHPVIFNEYRLVEKMPDISKYLEFHYDLIPLNQNEEPLSNEWIDILFTNSFEKHVLLPYYMGTDRPSEFDRDNDFELVKRLYKEIDGLVSEESYLYGELSYSDLLLCSLLYSLFHIGIKPQEELRSLIKYYERCTQAPHFRKVILSEKIDSPIFNARFAS